MARKAGSDLAREVNFPDAAGRPDRDYNFDDSDFASEESLDAHADDDLTAEAWDEAEQIRGPFFNGMTQAETNRHLLELCHYLPDDALLPEDHSLQVEMAVRHGAHLNVTTRYGWSVLHYAAFKGFARVCRKLVRLGADINAVNRDGSTPVMCAARFGRLQTAKVLIEMGANFKHCSHDGETVVDKAVRGPSRRLELMLRGLFRQCAGDETLDDGRTMKEGLRDTDSATEKPAPMRFHRESGEWQIAELLRNMNDTTTQPLSDPRLRWRPIGWDHKAIKARDRYEKDIPEVKEIQEEERIRELLGYSSE
mmetsp:Transcript_19167/g.43140  ORF Transcript_19167/g.43140 Transcript_19167/m.43140 type:complete len:309 (-) Transcript_19167:111-1037(-)